MKQNKTPFAAFLSISLASAASTGAVGADTSPFEIKEIGPNPADRLAEASGSAEKDAAGTMKGSGEMKCGANMMKGDGMMNKGGTMSAPKAGAEAAGGAKPDAKPSETESAKPSASH
jgi:hypothetical protein